MYIDIVGWAFFIAIFWFFCSFHWLRLISITIIMTVWAATLFIAPVFLIFNSWQNETGPTAAFMTVITVAVMFLPCMIYKITLDACLSWCRQNKISQPWNAR